MPRTRLSGAMPDTAAIFKLIAYYIKIERNSTVEETMEQTGYSKGLYYRRSKAPEDFSLKELRRFARVLKIPQQQLMEAIAEAMKY